jgi:hypothetical protein
VLHVKILGVGLSKTGTTSLHRALGILGYRSLHYDDRRLNDVVCGANSNPDFRRYDDVDAVLDIPAAWFFEQLLDAYPGCKCILTIRDEGAWWKSIHAHFNDRSPVTSPEANAFKWALRNYVYGSTVAHEFLFKKRYREHNERVLAKVPASQLLTMDVTAGDGWEKLCQFLACAVPTTCFPHQNRRQENEPEYWRRAQTEILRTVKSEKSFVLVDDQSLDRKWFPDHQVLPFVERDGEDWGPPPDDEAAIRDLERLRCRNPSHIVFTWSAFWWLDYYTGLQQHLRSRFPCVLENDQLVIFDLRGGSAKAP